MMIRLLAKLVAICSACVAAAFIVAAQDGAQSRSITSDDFASQRPVKAKATPGANRPAVAKKIRYKFVRRDESAIRWKTGPKTPVAKPGPANLPLKVSEIGVTIWKLRNAHSSDGGVKLPVKVNAATEMWTSVRVDPESEFNNGDRVRLAVESSVSGYLYVVDTEIRADGSFGEPLLIFPQPAGDNNAIRPGMLVDFPDQREDFPYFNMRSSRADYRGELLTVIVSPVRFTNIETDRDGRLLNIEEVLDLDLIGRIEIYTRTDTTDNIFTKAESESACGSKSRRIVLGATAGSPCGSQSRELTREEPLPQSIYRINGFAGKPAIAFIRLNVRP